MNISTVSFDLTGTLLVPFPSIGDLCADALRAQKIREIPSVATFNSRRFEARRVAQVNGHAPTSETRSRQYWRSMLWEIFAGCCSNRQFDIAVEYVYQRLSEPEHWKMMPAVIPALSALRFVGLKLVVLSNGDSRWKKALIDKNLFDFFDEIFLSSETGFAKPSVESFDNICRTMKIERGELLHVGDTLTEDIVPAHEFGAGAVWVTKRPTGLPPESVPLFDTLADLPEYVRMKLVAGNVTNKFSLGTRNMLADLRGLPEESFLARDFDGNGNKSASSKKIAARSFDRIDRAEREVPAVAPLFDKVLQSRGLFENSVQTRILESWGRCLPARFASMSVPLKLEKKMTSLLVSCENATVRQELEFQKRAILKNVRAIPGADKIKNITFVIE